LDIVATILNIEYSNIEYDTNKKFAHPE